MRKSKLLTRSMLEEMGIICVSGDGKHIILRNGNEAHHCVYKGAIGKYSGRRLEYDVVAIYDYSKKRVTKNGSSWAYEVKTIPVHRVVYAWFHQIIPENMDIDHIDHNTRNNAVSNLRCVTRKENNNNKVRQGNQYLCKWTDEQYLEYQDIKKRLESVRSLILKVNEGLARCDSKIENAKSYYDKCKRDFEIAKDNWHNASNNMKPYEKMAYDRYRRIFELASENWHNEIAYRNKGRDYKKELTATRDSLIHLLKDAKESYNIAQLKLIEVDNSDIEKLW